MVKYHMVINPSVRYHCHCIEPANALFVSESNSECQNRRMTKSKLLHIGSTHRHTKNIRMYVCNYSHSFVRSFVRLVRFQSNWIRFLFDLRCIFSFYMHMHTHTLDIPFARKRINNYIFPFFNFSCLCLVLVSFFFFFYYLVHVVFSIQQ